MGILQQPLDEIEQWRNEARQLSKSDNLGHVVVNSLELMQSVLVSGVDSESLRLKTKALAIECANAMASDPNKDDKSRSLHYGMASSLCAVLKVLTQLTEDEQQKAATMLGAELRQQEMHEERFQKPCRNEEQQKATTMLNEELQHHEDQQELVPEPSREATPCDMTAFFASIRAETEAKIQAERVLAAKKKRKSEPADVKGTSGHNQEMPSSDENEEEDDVVSTVPSDLLDEDYDPMMDEKPQLAKRKPGRPPKAEHLKRLEMKKRRASAPAKMLMIEPKKKRRPEQGAKGVEKPFACDLCGSAFMTKSSVFRHIRSEHKAKPFKCTDCGEAFMHDREKREHMKEHYY